MYLFYMDESGQREYSGPDRYFVLTALGVQDRNWKALNNDILTLKQTYFRDVKVEIKSSWLRFPHNRMRHYLEPYGITEDDLTEFVEKVYGALLGYDVVLIAAVIDKPQMRSNYVSPQQPSSLAYGLVFERIEKFLAHQSEETYGSVIFDKITELEMKKRGYEDLLAKQHLRYLEKGTPYISINHIVEGLLFIPSHENNLLQVVDLCSYNIFRQFLDHGDEWDKANAFSHKYSYFERIEPKLDRSLTGNYAGWGIKKFPG